MVGLWKKKTQLQSKRIEPACTVAMAVTRIGGR